MEAPSAHLQTGVSHGLIGLLLGPGTGSLQLFLPMGCAWPSLVKAPTSLCLLTAAPIGLKELGLVSKRGAGLAYLQTVSTLWQLQPAHQAFYRFLQMAAPLGLQNLPLVRPCGGKLPYRPTGRKSLPYLKVVARSIYPTTEVQAGLALAFLLGPGPRLRSICLTTARWYGW